MTIAFVQGGDGGGEVDDHDRGKNEFGDVCRQEGGVARAGSASSMVRSASRSKEGKMIMAALQSPVVDHEAETYALFRRVCLDCHTFGPVKDYITRRIRAVFGAVEVRNPRWMLCRECDPTMVGAFAPLKEICPDRAKPELMELTARLGSMMPYRLAAKVLAEFLPIESTEKHATGASAPSGSASGSTTRSRRKQSALGLKPMTAGSLSCSLLGIVAKNSSSALRCAGRSTTRMLMQVRAANLNGELRDRLRAPFRHRAKRPFSIRATNRPFCAPPDPRQITGIYRERVAQDGRR